MKLKYRVKGVVERSFILRGVYFALDCDIDFCVTENELAFVKDRCKVNELIDLESKKSDIPDSVLETPKNETKNNPQEVENDLQSKSLKVSSKGKSKAKVQLS